MQQNPPLCCGVPVFFFPIRQRREGTCLDNLCRPDSVEEVITAFITENGTRFD